MYRITDDCVACGSCLPVCPVKAIHEGEPFLINTRCVDCGECAAVCPVDAIVRDDDDGEEKAKNP